MASPIPKVTKVSKNAREGRGTGAAKRLCAEGHVLVGVMYVIRGRRRMRLVCACSGYEPINTSLPYRGLKGKVKTGGNARIWFEYPEARE